jgi:hypothetical protein
MDQSRTIDVTEDVKVGPVAKQQEVPPKVTPKAAPKAATKSGVDDIVVPSKKSATKKAAEPVELIVEEQEEIPSDADDEHLEEAEPADTSEVVSSDVSAKVLAAYSQFGMNEEDILGALNIASMSDMTVNGRTWLLERYHELKAKKLTVDKFKTMIVPWA